MSTSRLTENLGHLTGGAAQSSRSMTYAYKYTLGSKVFGFRNLAEVMAKATPARSGDRLAGVVERDEVGGVG